MKTYSEYRAAAWKETREGHWVSKALLVWLAMLLVFGIVEAAWNGAVTSMGIQTWESFLMAKLKANLSGLDFTVPSRTIAIRMTEASAFLEFVRCILNGILFFAMCSLYLRAAKGERARWFASSLGGFKRPLGMAWLYFRYLLQVMLWAALFLSAAGLLCGLACPLLARFGLGVDVTPAPSWPFARFLLLLMVAAVIAGTPVAVIVYRYCQCWNLKVENPDWPAGKCLAESVRMMKGHKWQRFSLDCSYWKPITLLMLGLLTWLLAIGAMEALGLGWDFLPIAYHVLAIGCMWGTVVLATYMSIGQALFYLDLKGKPASADVRK